MLATPVNKSTAAIQLLLLNPNIEKFPPIIKLLLDTFILFTTPPVTFALKVFAIAFKGFKAARYLKLIEPPICVN